MTDHAHDIDSPSPSNARTKEAVIQMRITAREKQILSRVAARDGLGLSTWLRWIALREVETRSGSVPNG